MASARFCSECGERIKIRHSRIPSFRCFCRPCSPRFRRFRLMLIAIPVLCVLVGFAIGHYTVAREPFYLMGTPVDLTTNRVAPSGDNNGNHSFGGKATTTLPEQLLISPSATDGICGARTKSGKPCRRRVNDGGYCWQHRD